MKKLLILSLLVLPYLTVHAAEGFSTLEERMTSKEFNATGLDKLSKEQLAALNEWLRRHSVATLENSATDGTANNGDSSTADDADDKIIRSTIAGLFEGWSGKDTMFKLANGQIWQQAEKDAYYPEPAMNVEVELRKPKIGKWRMSVVGTEREIRVVRIQ